MQLQPVASPALCPFPPSYMRTHGLAMLVTSAGSQPHREVFAVFYSDAYVGLHTIEAVKYKHACIYLPLCIVRVPQRYFGKYHKEYGGF